LAYNRDLQEDKTALFDAADTIVGMLSVVAPLVRQTKLKREVIAAKLDDGFLDATTLMEAFIVRGVPMRSAHEAVGQLVRLCETKKCRLIDLPASEFEAVVKGGSSIRQSLGAANAIAAFKSYGSTAPAEVAKQLQYWQTQLMR